MRNRFSKMAIAFAAMFVMSFAAVATAQIDYDKVNKLSFGKVQGTITLPSNGQLTCSQLRVGLNRTVSGDLIGVQSAGPVTPTPAGAGKCSYSLTALATGWQVGAGHASPSQFTLSYQVTPSAYVTIQKGQTAIRDIKITAVNPYEPPH